MESIHMAYLLFQPELQGRKSGPRLIVFPGNSTMAQFQMECWFAMRVMSRDALTLPIFFLGTVADNNRDCESKGRRTRGGYKNRGSRHGMNKLSEADVTEIRRIYSTYPPHKHRGIADLAERFNVSKSCINSVIQVQTWLHLT
jgi:hypothetical protein